jgi:putative addiction module component (TIGR02574 family)
VTDRAEQLLDAALKLSESERADLAARLIQSLDSETDSEVDAAWATEIERRCAALDSGEAVTSDWSEVRQRIEREIFGR